MSRALRLVLLASPMTACSLVTGLDDLQTKSVTVMTDAAPVTAHFLDESFDDDGGAPPAVLGSLVINAGSVAVASDTYWSPFHSLHAEASGPAGVARFSRDLPPAATHVVIDARVLPCKYPSSGFVSIAELLCKEGDIAGGVWLHFFPTRGGVRVISDMSTPGQIGSEKDIDFDSDAQVVMPGGTWSHLHLDVRYGVNGSVTLGVDGHSLPTFTGPVGCATGGTNRLVLGVYVSDQGASCATNYDDVVVDVE